jgi:hypothetical protein
MEPAFEIFPSPNDAPSLLRYLLGKKLLTKVVVFRDFNIISHNKGDIFTAYNFSSDTDPAGLLLRNISVSPFKLMKYGSSEDTQEISDSTYTLY